MALTPNLAQMVGTIKEIDRLLVQVKALLIKEIEGASDENNPPPASA